MTALAAVDVADLPWHSRILDVLRAQGVSVTPTSFEAASAAIVRPAIHGLLMPWLVPEAPLLIERIRRYSKRWDIPVVVVAQEPLELLMRWNLAAAVLAAPGVVYIQLPAETAFLCEATQRVVRAVHRLAEEPLDAEAAHSYLIGIPALRGVKSQHQQRDAVGPVLVMHVAATQFRREHVAKLRGKLQQDIIKTRSTASTPPERLTWEKVCDLMTSLGEPRWTGGHVPRPARWLLIDDNAYLWRTALQPFVTDLPTLNIESKLDLASVTKQTAGALLQHTLNKEPIDGVLIGLALHRDDPERVTCQQDVRACSGMKAVIKLRKEDVTTPVVLLTGADSAWVTEEVKKYGCSYLMKPGELGEAQEFANTLRKVLEPTPYLDVRQRLMRFVRRRASVPVGHYSLSADIYTRFLKDGLSLWTQALLVQSAGASAEALRRLALVMFGMAVEAICDWLVDNHFAELRNSRSYTLLPGTPRSAQCLFKLYDTDDQPYRLRSAAAHVKPRRSVSFNDATLAQSARAFLGAMKDCDVDVE